MRATRSAAVEAAAKGLEFRLRPAFRRLRRRGLKHDSRDVRTHTIRGAFTRDGVVQASSKSQDLVRVFVDAEMSPALLASDGD